MRGWGRGKAMAGVILACGAAGMALAQKPPPAGAPAQEGKPQAAQPSRPPVAAPPAAAPAPEADKFGQPVQPPAAATPEPDKFASPPPAPAVPVPPGPPRQAAPATPPPPGFAAPVTPPSPDEPDAVRRLRQLLGADTRLAYASAEVIDPARGSARLREVVLTRADRSAAIAELTLDGLRDDGVTEAILRGVLLREGAAPGAAGDQSRIERVRIANLGVTRPAPGQPPRPDMMRFDQLRIEGLSVGGDTPVALASLTVEDYGNGRPGRLALEGLEVRQPGQAGPVDRVSLGRLTLRGIDLAAYFAAAVAKQAPPRTVGSAALEAEDLVLGRGDQRVGGLAALSLSGESPPAVATGAETGRLALRGISVQPFPGLAEWMQRFGYRELVGDMTMDVRIDRAAQRMEIGSLSLAARDIGALGFAMTLEGVNAEETDPAALLGARLASMRLRFVDQSLYGRFVRMQAQQTRRTEQQVREELAAQARALFERPQGGGGRGGAPGGAPGGKGGGPAASGSTTMEIGNAVQRFLRGQAREIEIAAQPARPVPFSDLQGMAAGGPDALQQALGLTVTTR